MPLFTGFVVNACTGPEIFCFDIIRLERFKYAFPTQKFSVCSGLDVDHYLPARMFEESSKDFYWFLLMF